MPYLTTFDPNLTTSGQLPTGVVDPAMWYIVELRTSSWTFWYLTRSFISSSSRVIQLWKKKRHLCWPWSNLTYRFSAFAHSLFWLSSVQSQYLVQLEQQLKIGQRIEEYRFAYKFYQELLNLYKAKELSESDVSKRVEFIKTLNFFPREKYIK